MKKILIYVFCLTLITLCFSSCDLKLNALNRENFSSQQPIASSNRTASEEDASIEIEESSDEQEEDKSAWKDAYLNFIEKAKREEGKYGEYALVYIDNDDIPELFIGGTCEASGTLVCAYKNGKVVSEHLRRLYGASYIPKSGLVMNFNGNMGNYSAEVFKLTNKGFTCIFYGTQEERVTAVPKSDMVNTSFGIQEYNLIHIGYTPEEIGEDDGWDPDTDINNSSTIQSSSNNTKNDQSDLEDGSAEDSSTIQSSSNNTKNDQSDLEDGSAEDSSTEDSNEIEDDEDIYDEDDYEYILDYDYFIGQKKVSEKEFWKAIEAVFKTSKAKDVSSAYVSYAKIKKIIKNA